MTDEILDDGLVNRESRGAIAAILALMPALDEDEVVECVGFAEKLNNISASVATAPDTRVAADTVNPILLYAYNTIRENLTALNATMVEEYGDL